MQKKVITKAAVCAAWDMKMVQVFAGMLTNQHIIEQMPKILLQMQEDPLEAAKDAAH